MPEPVMLPTADTAAKLREAVSKPGRAAAGPGGVPGWHPVAAVECGANTDTDPIPYYEGTIQGIPGLDAADWTGAANAVVLADLNGTELTAGQVYNAVRYGQTAGGVPVYWTDHPPVFLSRVSTTGGIVTITSNTTWTSGGSAYEVSVGAGTYLVSAVITAEGQASAMGASYGLLVARLYDSTNGALVADTEAAVLQFFTAGQYNLRTTGLSWLVFNSAPRTLVVQGWRNSAPTWTTSGFIASGFSTGQSRLSAVKVG